MALAGAQQEVAHFILCTLDKILTSTTTFLNGKIYDTDSFDMFIIFDKHYFSTHSLFPKANFIQYNC